jgi:branched-chain amino acid transport system permease protein
MSTFLQLTISGLLVGGVYGLIAMGFVTVYRSIKVFNMAYGQFAVLGAYMAWTFLGSSGSPRLPLALGILCTLAFAVIFALFIEWAVFRRLIGKPVFASFIITLGLMAIINSLVMVIWGPQPKGLQEIVPKGIYELGGIIISKEYLWTFVIALILMIGFAIFFQKTRLGLAIRASNNNQTAARLLGVSAKFNSRIAWIFCTLLATLGGILIASVQGVSSSLAELVLVVLVVVLIGGMDSLAGCIAGGLVLAIGNNLSSYYLDPYLPGLSTIFGVILILLILLFRPNGIFGFKPVERV